MTEQAFDDQCTSGNPRYPLLEEIREMYKGAYYGERGTPQGKRKINQITRRHC
jgi:hypothetical protein